ncbi:hypothetical protein GCM10022243_67510 [Saccharothrix violaceirubra]|uniref:Uncharacterized protein n=1 Tax=Saccharothrix violaceirubra TaxID=413306 RepID=A0A7W7WW84_9PSEU|nr:hypothetical protein [Saccharothrix violaceirubra]MBB4965298.1 hypothetical protein [Saccharothrix violaceirubra]
MLGAESATTVATNTAAPPPVDASSPPVSRRTTGTVAPARNADTATTYAAWYQPATENVCGAVSSQFSRGRGSANQDACTTAPAKPPATAPGTDSGGSPSRRRAWTTPYTTSGSTASPSVPLQ